MDQLFSILNDRNRDLKQLSKQNHREIKKLEKIRQVIENSILDNINLNHMNINNISQFCNDCKIVMAIICPEFQIEMDCNTLDHVAQLFQNFFSQNNQDKKATKIADFINQRCPKVNYQNQIPLVVLMLRWLISTQREILKQKILVIMQEIQNEIDQKTNACLFKRKKSQQIKVQNEIPQKNYMKKIQSQRTFRSDEQGINLAFAQNQTRWKVQSQKVGPNDKNILPLIDKHNFFQNQQPSLAQNFDKKVNKSMFLEDQKQPHKNRPLPIKTPLFFKDEYDQRQKNPSFKNKTTLDQIPERQKPILPHSNLSKQDSQNFKQEKQTLVKSQINSFLQIKHKEYLKIIRQIMIDIDIFDLMSKRQGMYVGEIKDTVLYKQLLSSNAYIKTKISGYVSQAKSQQPQEPPYLPKQKTMLQFQRHKEFFQLKK